MTSAVADHTGYRIFRQAEWYAHIWGMLPGLEVPVVGR